MKHDKTMETIKRVVASVIPEGRILLFGSRARGDAHPASDHDLLILVKNPLSMPEKIRLSCTINRLLVREGLVCDVLLQSEQEARDKAVCTASIVREALREGVPV